MKVKKDQRESNFELLRIIAMLLIVAGHFITQSGALDATTGINHYFAGSIGLGHRMAVNLFVMIGTWFMVDMEFKPKRVLRLYSVVWFYSVIITLICRLSNVPISTGDLISAFFPFIRRAVWFASVYMGLMLLSPFLHNFRELSLKKQKKAVAVSFLLICVECTLSKFMDTYLCALTWFVFLYLFIAYHKECMKQGVSVLKWKRYWYLLIGMVLYLGMVAVEGICFTFMKQIPVLATVRSLDLQFLLDYKSLPNFISAFCIFLYFEKLDIGKNRLINTIAGSTFGVYVIHQIPVFYMFLWKNICHSDFWISGSMFPVYTLTVVFGVFFGAIIIDKLRGTLLEPLWIESPLFCLFNRILEKWYQGTEQ